LLYADDNQKRHPALNSSASIGVWWMYKEQVKGFLGMQGKSSPNDKFFACPNDRGYEDSPSPFYKSPKFDYESYCFNGVNLPGVPNIAGRELSSIREPRQTLLVMEWTAHAPLSWHKSKTGKENSPFYSDAESIVAFVDGHVSPTKIYYDGINAAYTRDPIPGYEYKYSPE
jgi:prepilin-type processing-associated H-X9-DG protein